MRISDWSSDVCSSDLRIAFLGHLLAAVEDHQQICRDRRLHALEPAHQYRQLLAIARFVGRTQQMAIGVGDRKSVVEGKSVSVRVDLGGRRLIKKTEQTTLKCHTQKENTIQEDP